MYKRALSLIEVLVVAGLLCLLVTLLLPTPSGSRELSHRAICASNLRGIGQGLHIYGKDNAEHFPTHYYDASASVDWIGSMGSTDKLLISQETSPTVSPRRSHPSRSLFLIVTGGQSTPGQFVCPQSSTKQDDLRNRGSDAGDLPGPHAAQPGPDRFDFRGLDHLSYGYQFPFGPTALSQALPAQTVLVADRGPYSTSVAALNGTTTDARKFVGTPNVASDIWLNWKRKDWRQYNSPNHDGEGQNVLFVDGHVEFSKTPMAGLNNDNVYTIQNPNDPDAGNIGDIGKAPTRVNDTYLLP